MAHGGRDHESAALHNIDGGDGDGTGSARTSDAPHRPCTPSHTVLQTRRPRPSATDLLPDDYDGADRNRTPTSRDHERQTSHAPTVGQNKECPPTAAADRRDTKTHEHEAKEPKRQ